MSSLHSELQLLQPVVHLVQVEAPPFDVVPLGHALQLVDVVTLAGVPDEKYPRAHCPQ